MYHHRSYGLLFASSETLPELSPVITNEDLDADIVIGWNQPSPVPITDTGLWADDEGMRIDVSGIARYRITRNHIGIWPLPDAEHAVVRQFLFGPVLASVLHLHDFIVLHGSGVQLSDSTAVLFLGESGTGKSTLCHALTQRGYPAIADDIIAVRLTADGSAVVFPGGAHGRLWGDALDRLGIPYHDLRRVNHEEDKYVVPRLPVQDIPLSIARIYELSIHDGEPSLDRGSLHGMQRLATLDRHLYRRELLRTLGVEASSLRQLLSLVPLVQVEYLRRKRETNVLTEMMDLVEAHAGIQASSVNTTVTTCS